MIANPENFVGILTIFVLFLIMFVSAFRKETEENMSGLRRWISGKKRSTNTERFEGLRGTNTERFEGLRGTNTERFEGLRGTNTERFEGLSYYNATHNPWYNDWYRPWAGNNCFNKSCGCYGRSSCCS